jgi:O-antigen/teichoic acid export membrane protein
MKVIELVVVVWMGVHRGLFRGWQRSAKVTSSRLLVEYESNGAKVATSRNNVGWLRVLLVCFWFVAAAHAYGVYGFVIMFWVVGCGLGINTDWLCGRNKRHVLGRSCCTSWDAVSFASLLRSNNKAGAKFK